MALARPYTQRTFRRRLRQFDDLMNEVTLKDVEATADEKRQLITEHVRFEDFCDSIRTLFGSDMRNQDIKPIYQKISANPDVQIDWSELFGYSDTKSRSQGQGHEKSSDDADLDDNIAAAVATGKNANVFAVNSRRRVGPAAGNKYRRDVAVAIRYVAPLDCYLTVSQKGTLSTWSNRLRLLICVDVGDKTWVTGCEYLPEIRRVAVCTERSISLVDIRANGKNQQSVVITPLDNTPQCITHVPYNNDDTDSNGETRDIILFGDDQGCVTQLTIDMVDLTGPKPTSIAGLSNAQKRTGKVPINIDPSRLTVPTNTRKLHPSWVLKVKFIPELSCFASCCASEQSSFILEHLNVLKDNTELRNIELNVLKDNNKPVRSISINKGVNAFSYCRTANIIVTGGIDKVLRVWHPTCLSSPSGRLFGHIFTIVDIEVNNVDQHIISLSTARVIRVWDIHTLTALQVFNDTSDIAGEKRIYSMFFDDVHEHLMTGSSVLDVWPLTRAVQNTIQVPHTHERPITALIYNRELNQIASGCTETVLRVWDADTGKPLYHIDAAHGDCGELTAMAVDETGYRLATGATDGSIKVWDFGSGQELKSTIPSQAQLRLKSNSSSQAQLSVNDDNCGIISIFFCHFHDVRCIAAVGWCNRIVILSDSTKSRHLPILREFNYSYPSDVMPYSASVEGQVTDQQLNQTDTYDEYSMTSLLDAYQVTCASTSMMSSKFVMATGCSNGSIILWDMSATTAVNIIYDYSERTTDRDINNAESAVVALLFINLSCDDVTVGGVQTNDDLDVANDHRVDENITDNTQTTDVGGINADELADQRPTDGSQPPTPLNSDEVLASSHADGIVCVWTLEGEKLCEIAHRNYEPVTAMCFDKSAGVFYTGDNKGYIAQWAITRDNLIQDNTSQDNEEPTTRIVKLKEVLFWRSHLVKITQLVVLDKFSAILSASLDSSVRVWTTNGARYVGFLGQPRDLIFNNNRKRDQQGTSTTSSDALPHDINDGPMCPLKTASAVRRQQEERLGRLTCPLLFDNARWKKRRPPPPIKRQSTKLSSVLSRESTVVKLPFKNKFFDALFKPCPDKNQLESYTTGSMAEGAVYRALPVYTMTTPDRPKTPQLSLPKLTSYGNKDPPTNDNDQSDGRSTSTPIASVRRNSKQKVVVTSRRATRKTHFMPSLTPNSELAE